MDTCCIDKTNPSDTQEAINAMFRWYQNAGVCYAYLSGVGNVASSTSSNRTGSQPSIASGHLPLSSHRTDLNHSFKDARWFTRGWTLQELLASHDLIFVDQTWRRIGTRESRAAEIENVTGIETRHLRGFTPTDIGSSSIAIRLSWASQRKTTLEEDEAYSLLGLFGISMPLIYGEGRQHAFYRFQRELIMFYDDDSILAWECDESVMRTHDGGTIPSCKLSTYELTISHPLININSQMEVNGGFSHTLFKIFCMLPISNILVPRTETSGSP
jgi:hypothetical protein